MEEIPKLMKKNNNYAKASFIFGVLTILLLSLIIFLINSSLAWWKYDVLEGALVLGSFILPTLAVISGAVGLIRAHSSTTLSLLFSLFGVIIGLLGIFISLSLKGPR